MATPHPDSARRLGLALLALAWLGCDASPPATTGAAGGSAPAAPSAKTITLVVLAASSLREAFTDLAAATERETPTLHVALSFAGSQDLRAQIEHGAPADVVALADRAPLDALTAAGLAEAPRVFARNFPVLLASPEAAPRVPTLAELPQAERIVLGAPEVPIGRYTGLILDRADARFGGGFRARVEARVVSRELNVRQVLAKLSLGEAEAGIVYATDAAAAPPGLVTRPIPEALNVVAEYPIAVLTHAAQPAAARRFVERVLSPEGARVLAGRGFLPPSAPPSAAP